MSRLDFMKVVIAGVLFVTAPAGAQTQRSGGGESQRIMQQYQQVSAEKTALQSQVAQMKTELDAAKAELTQLKKERDALKGRAAGSSAAATRLVAQANASRESLEKSLEQSKQRTTELVDRFKETIGTLKGVEADRDAVRRSYQELSAKYDKCADNNDQLYQLSDTVLDRYSKVGFFTKAAAAEPFTRITRTRIDNLALEYHERAEELRLKKSGQPAPNPAASPAPLPTGY